MALSGSLDTFALPDVLRLLASTGKSGRLRVTGDRGSGSVWVDGGEVVATELASAVSLDPTAAEVVFGLLRFAAGSFSFEPDAVAPNADSPRAMEPILSEAEGMLVEWRAIEEVIPSLDVWVGLTAELAGPDVMVDRARWGGIAAIGSGAQVGAVAETLHLNEIESCRLVKELMELGLVEFIEVPSAAVETSFEPDPVAAAPLEETVDTEPEPVAAAVEPGDVDGDVDVHGDVDGDVESEPAHEAEALLDDFGTFGADEPHDGHDLFADDGVAAGGMLDDGPADDHLSDTGTVPSLAALGADDDLMSNDLMSNDLMSDAMVVAGGDDLDPAEMARQLANLSPKAAKAVAAAAKATTEAERDAALAAVEAEDESVNRGLLLKFLGSVEST